MYLRRLALATALMLASLSSLPALAQAIPGYASVERVYPVGERGTQWKLKCGRNLPVSATGRAGFHDRSGVYEHDRPEVFQRGRHTCIQIPKAAGRFVGYRARANANGRIFDQFVSGDTQPGDRIRLLPSATFVGYDDKANATRPQRDWGDRYFPGYPYGARY